MSSRVSSSMSSRGLGWNCSLVLGVILIDWLLGGSVISLGSRRVLVATAVHRIHRLGINLLLALVSVPGVLSLGLLVA